MRPIDSHRFLWCCGIEDTFISDPHPQTGKTLDEYELTGHYDVWREDFDRIHTLGVDALRWGIPWYKVNPAKHTWDWSWTDEAIHYLVADKKIELILDLMHYGTPRWLPNAFIDPDYPRYVEEYTAQVVERYGSYLHYVTPFNEPHTACEFAGNRGWWPPYLHGYEGYMQVFRGVMQGSLRQTRLLQEAGITCVQVECAGGSWANDPAFEGIASTERALQSMYFDFLTGDMASLQPFQAFLTSHGLTQADLDFFAVNGRPIDIMGINYYPQFSFQQLSKAADGTMLRSNHQEWIEDFEQVILERHEKYHCPMMITETSIRDDQVMKYRWLHESTAMAKRIHGSGIPLVGYTWFPIIDMYDWEYRVFPGMKDDYRARFGFWDQERTANPCAEAYRELIAGYKGIGK